MKKVVGMDKNRIGIFGYRGMIGRELVNRGCSPLDTDITDSVKVEKSLREVQPLVVINCAAKTNVDWCEANKKKAFDSNVYGASVVFSIAEKMNIPVVQFTSDHVFSGKFLGRYKELTQDDYMARIHFSPVNYYGLTKLGVEATTLAFDNVKLIRMSCVVSPTRPSISNYLTKIKRHECVDPPIFMRRSFIHVNHLVENLFYYIDNFRKMPNLLNLSGSKTVSWYRLIKEYAKKDGLEKYVKPRFFDKHMSWQADRPHRNGLDTSLSKSLGFKQYDYKDCVNEGLGSNPLL